MSSSSAHSASSLGHPHQQIHQPYWSEDPRLHSNPLRFYRRRDGIIQRGPLEMSYPEVRDINDSGLYDFVYHDDFLKDGETNYVPPDPANGHPENILGQAFADTGSPFDLFLRALLQLCRNYNYDLQQLRYAFFVQLHFKPGLPDPMPIPTAVARYRQSCDDLWSFLSHYDPDAPEGQQPPVFESIAVELLKFNGFIYGVRAGANDKDSLAEFLFSSLSHVSISSMYSTNNPPSSSSAVSESSASDSSTPDSSSSDSSFPDSSSSDSSAPDSSSSSEADSSSSETSSDSTASESSLSSDAGTGASSSAMSDSSSGLKFTKPK